MLEAKKYSPLIFDKNLKDYAKFKKNTSEYFAFWKEQKRRLKEGYKPTGGVFIPGNYYFYLNFSKIHGLPTPDSRRKSMIPPIYRDQDHEYFTEVHNAKYGDGKRRNVFGTFGISVKDDSSPTGYTSVGSVGTGFSDGDLMFLTTELKKIVEEFTVETFHILPRVVLEITCDLISRDAEGNYGLRFPRAIRIRNDKFPKDCNSMLDVEMMA